MSSLETETDSFPGLDWPAKIRKLAKSSLQLPNRCPYRLLCRLLWRLLCWLLYWLLYWRPHESPTKSVGFESEIGGSRRSEPAPLAPRAFAAALDATFLFPPVAPGLGAPFAIRFAGHRIEAEGHARNVAQRTDSRFAHGRLRIG